MFKTLNLSALTCLCMTFLPIITADQSTERNPEKSLPLNRYDSQSESAVLSRHERIDTDREANLLNLKPRVKGLHYEGQKIEKNLSGAEIDDQKLRRKRDLKQAEIPVSSVADVDMMFVMDESGSLGIKNFKLMLDFYTAIAKKLLDIAEKDKKLPSTSGKSGFQLGTVGFCDKIMTQKPLSSAVTFEGFQKEMTEKVKNRTETLRQNKCKTNINKGIEQAVKQFEESPNKEGRRRIVLLLTDGKNNEQQGSEDQDSFRGIVEKFNDKQSDDKSKITTIAIAVGEDTDDEYLDRSADEFLKIKKFDELESDLLKLILSTVGMMVNDCVRNQNIKTSCAPKDDASGNPTGSCEAEYEWTVEQMPDKKLNKTCEGETRFQTCKCPVKETTTKSSGVVAVPDIAENGNVIGNKPDSLRAGDSQNADTSDGAPGWVIPVIIVCVLLLLLIAIVALVAVRRKKKIPQRTGTDVGADPKSVMGKSEAVSCKLMSENTAARSTTKPAAKK